MTIVSSDYVVDESQSSVEVCVSLTDIPAGGLECEVVATINTTDGPKASMSFYMPQTQTTKASMSPVYALVHVMFTVYCLLFTVYTLSSNRVKAVALTSLT